MIIDDKVKIEESGDINKKINDILTYTKKICEVHKALYHLTIVNSDTIKITISIGEKCIDRTIMINSSPIPICDCDYYNRIIQDMINKLLATK